MHGDLHKTIPLNENESPHEKKPNLPQGRIRLSHSMGYGLRFKDGLKLCMTCGSREGNDVSNVGHARDVHDETLKS